MINLGEPTVSRLSDPGSVAVERWGGGARRSRGSRPGGPPRRRRRPAARAARARASARSRSASATSTATAVRLSLAPGHTGARATSANTAVTSSEPATPRPVIARLPRIAPSVTSAGALSIAHHSGSEVSIRSMMPGNLSPSHAWARGHRRWLPWARRRGGRGRRASARCACRRTRRSRSTSFAARTRHGGTGAGRWRRRRRSMRWPGPRRRRPPCASDRSSWRRRPGHRRRPGSRSRGRNHRGSAPRRSASRRRRGAAARRASGRPAPRRASRPVARAEPARRHLAQGSLVVGLGWEGSGCGGHGVRDGRRSRD